MRILAIESSCDDTAAAVIEANQSSISIVSSVISSQIPLHQKFGGVVPELAAREHVGNILPVINEALMQAGAANNIKNHIEAIAVTTGPGLITSLMVGIETAKTIAHTLSLPLVGVNHIEGHIYANFIGDNLPKLPAIILTVSGGHTNLILMNTLGELKIIGQTRDDAAGEAFDKAAQLMSLGYPGGPAISKFAATVNDEDAKSFSVIFPRPMINSQDFNFSFSGLKTSLLYALKKDDLWRERIPLYCKEFEAAIVDVLISKTLSAAKKFNAKTILLAGGVSANSKLRHDLEKAAIKNQILFSAPQLAYTTDNAAMIGAAAYQKILKNQYSCPADLRAEPNLEIK